MTHKTMSLAHKYITVVPDWARKNVQDIASADFEQAVIANIGMPTSPVFFADQVVDGVRTVISWDKHYASEVKCLQ
jgi:hypothetical protein